MNEGMHSNRVRELRHTAVVPHVIVVPKDHPNVVPLLVCPHAPPLPQRVFGQQGGCLQMLELRVPLRLPHRDDLLTRADLRVSVLFGHLLDHFMHVGRELERRGPAHGEEELGFCGMKELPSDRSEDVLESTEPRLRADVRRHKPYDDRCSLPNHNLQICTGAIPSSQDVQIYARYLRWLHRLLLLLLKAFPDRNLHRQVPLITLIDPVPCADPARRRSSAGDQFVLQAVLDETDVFQDGSCRQPLLLLRRGEIAARPHDDPALVATAHDPPDLSQAAVVVRTLHILAQLRQTLPKDVLLVDIAVAVFVVLGPRDTLRRVVRSQAVPGSILQPVPQGSQCSLRPLRQRVQRRRPLGDLCLPGQGRLPAAEAVEIGGEAAPARPSHHRRFLHVFLQSCNLPRLGRVRMAIVSRQDVRGILLARGRPVVQR
mmetsp:Transcript_84554/g.261672  ORF Transcript_84554/g.261672 Transcript_84554/m.261672 type:complete len:429 (-) Transcript_84554:113-1399(-)